MAVKHQGHLKEILYTLFPKHNIHCNARKIADISSPHSSLYLELDFWIPELKLSFEFQDKYHFSTVWNSHTPTAIVNTRDDIKRDAVKERGGTIIEVPYWWNGESESLIATICKYRPELENLYFDKEKLSDPIPLQPPLDYLKNEIATLGEPMLASFTKNSLDSNSLWWLSEKYDGVRAIWHPRDRKLYSKNNTVIKAPTTITSFGDTMPNSFLDGELWFGRGSFSLCLEMLFSDAESKNFGQKKMTTTTNWDTMRYIVFDSPLSPSLSSPYEIRFSSLLNLDLHLPTVLTANIKLLGENNIKEQFFKNIIDKGGEGTILRKQNSPYINGRSESLYKYKASRDIEAIITDFRFPVYHLILPNSNTIVAELSTSFDINTQIQIGDVVTCSFTNISPNGNPISPIIERVRRDTTVDQILNSGIKYYSGKKSIKDNTRKENGFWSYTENNNLRNFFVEFANKRNMTRAEDWYTIKKEDILQEKDGATVLSHYGGSFVKAIMDIFPNYSFQESHFSHMQNGYWKYQKNRKDFFDKLAKKFDFDASDADGWYSISQDHVKQLKGGASVLEYYGNSLYKALKELYPALNLIEKHFHTRNYWASEENRREFFVQYALKHGLETSNADDWYHVTNSDIKKEVGGSSILQQYGSVSQALIDLFQDVDFKSNTWAHKSSHWHVRENRRIFFDTFSKKFNLNPSIPSMWPKEEFLSERNGKLLMSFYGGSLEVALQDLYHNNN